MNKKLLLIVVGVGIILAAAGGVLFFVFKPKPGLIKPVSTEEQGPAEKVERVTWKDPAGFSFEYPKNIEIDPHDEDQENYAHLELTSVERPGKILVWVKDTSFADIADWAEQESTTGGQILDSELGGEPAKKVTWVDPAKLVLAAIDADVLVLVEMLPEDESFWQEIFDEVASSFTFIPLESEEPAAPGAWEGSGGSGGVIEEAEEVIE